MFTIKEDIFELISQYKEGTLSKKQHKEVEHFLASDKDYQDHLTYYNTITSALSDAANDIDKTRLREWHLEGITKDSVEAYEVTLDQERKQAKRNLNLLWLSGLLLTAAIFFFLGRFTVDSGSQNPPIESSPSQRDPGEIKLAAPGITNSKTVTYSIYKLENEKLIVLDEAYKNISINESDSKNFTYEFKNNTLQLFYRNSSTLDPASIEWISFLNDSTLQYYLKVNDILYQLKPTESIQILTKETDETILALFK